MAIDFKFIGYVNGILLLVLSLIFAITGLTGLMPGGSGGMEFLIAALSALFLGGLLFLTNYNRSRRHISLNTGYFLTVSCWLSVSAFSTLPLYFGGLGLSLTDAVFETVSGITTTGSTVLTGLDDMPLDILLWRSLMQWMGGLGIVVMAMAVLPFLRIGGMNLFKSESSDISGKVTPRVAHFVKLTALVYFLLTFLCAVLMHLAGMSWFDALNHAMTTIATAGFSTHDASLGYFDSVAIETVTIVFMLAGALPLFMYANLLFVNQKNFSLSRYSQVKAFFLIWIIAVAAVTIWNWQANGLSFLYAFRLTVFNVTSILTTTGYASADFGLWGGFAVGVFFFLFFIGGCAGSTSSAIKIFRWQILLSGLQMQFLKNLSPNRALAVRYAGHPVEERVLHGIRNFLFLYLLTFVFFSLVLMAFGLDFVTSLSGSAQAIANMGPGLGDIIGPAGNYSSLPDGAKWTLCAAMFLGRVELYTFYMLLVPAFWKR